MSDSIDSASCSSSSVSATDSKATEIVAKGACDQNSSELFNNENFSDLLIKFSDRQIYGHRIILCRGCEYFNKLCGPNSHFAESKMKEVTLHDDDADALEAMLLHLYNYYLKFPSSSLETLDKVRYYCQVVVVSDKYDVPSLAQEALERLRSFVLAEAPVASVLFASLRVLTDEFSDYSSLEELAVSLAQPHLGKMADLPEFSSWIALRPTLLPSLVQDAMAFRNLRGVNRYRCSLCGNMLVGVFRPRCCKNIPASVGSAYVNDQVYRQEF